MRFGALLTLPCRFLEDQESAREVSAATLAQYVSERQDPEPAAVYRSLHGFHMASSGSRLVSGLMASSVRTFRVGWLSFAGDEEAT